MNYLSTRGGSKGLSSAEAIRLGIAPDGGLFTPERLPGLSREELHSMLGLSYQELAVKILSSYLSDFSAIDLEAMISAAYAYPAKWADARITPVAALGEDQYIIELFHGPTCAFKDVALQLLPYLMTKAGELAQDPNEIIILVATSGDTGKAALEGFKDVPGTRIIVFYPEQGVSDIQKLQMMTQEGLNTMVVGVHGNFDDAQTGVKRIFTDPAMIESLRKRRMSFSSANSINWGRLAPQIVYYFYGYLELCRQGKLHCGDRLNVAVPTGNFGNILAAYFAKEMGLPVGKLICASNSNNVLTDFIQSGIYSRNRPFHTTISPSMDILISSNLERLLYYLAGENPEPVRQWMERLKESGEYEVDPETAGRIKNQFASGFATEAETMDTIRQVFSDTRYVLDPHTAVGKAVADRYRRMSGDTAPVLIAATASPFKFNSAVIGAISGAAAVQGLNEFQLLEKLQLLSGAAIPTNLRSLAEKQILHTKVCRTDEMQPVVSSILGV
jgi:threonine synthase